MCRDRCTHAALEKGIHSKGYCFGNKLRSKKKVYIWMWYQFCVYICMMVLLKNKIKFQQIKLLQFHFTRHITQITLNYHATWICFVSAILWSIGFEIRCGHSLVPLKVNLSKWKYNHTVPNRYYETEARKTPGCWKFLQANPP